MTRNRLIIGLTGGSGSGKSIVAKAAKDLGFSHIDTDTVGHEVILKPKPAYYEILNTFGTLVLNSHGEIDRKKLGDIVFNDAYKLAKLSKITHPAITDYIINNSAEMTIVDGAVLHQVPELIKMCKYIICVSNSTERRIEFICKRDNISAEQATKRINSQPDNNFYENLSNFVIVSDCTEDELYNKAYNLIKRCIIEKDC